MNPTNVMDAIKHAAGMVISALSAAIGESGQGLVLDMGEPVKLVELARLVQVVREYRPSR